MTHWLFFGRLGPELLWALPSASALALTLAWHFARGDGASSDLTGARTRYSSTTSVGDAHGSTAAICIRMPIYIVGSFQTASRPTDGFHGGDATGGGGAWDLPVRSSATDRDGGATRGNPRRNETGNDLISSFRKYGQARAKLEHLEQKLEIASNYDFWAAPSVRPRWPGRSLAVRPFSRRSKVWNSSCESIFRWIQPPWIKQGWTEQR